MSISGSSREALIGKMGLVNLRGSLRIVWAVVAAFVFLARSSAAPAFGGADRATVSKNFVRETLEIIYRNNFH